MKNIYLWITGVLTGVILFMGVRSCVVEKRNTGEISHLMDSITALSVHRDTIYDTTWRTVEVIKPVPRPYPVPYPVHDTIIDEGCVMNWYNDTIHFDDLDLAYNLGTIGTLKDMQFGYKLKLPKEIIITKPCPPVVVPVVSPWSVTLQVGYPAAAYIGLGYRILPGVDAVGGVHSSFTSPQKANVLVGISVKL